MSVSKEYREYLERQAKRAERQAEREARGERVLYSPHAEEDSGGELTNRVILVGAVVLAILIVVCILASGDSEPASVVALWLL